MQYRRFGRTELQLPVLSCGGMRYQHSWKDVSLADVPRKNQENLEAIIRRALEVGIRCFNVESVPELERLNRVAGERQEGML